MQTLIRQATIDDKKDIWDFINIAYGDHAKDKIPDRWNWAFYEHPLTNKSQKTLPIFIAIKDGHIVGQLCAIQSYMKIGEEIYPTVGGCDFIVLPECRKEGVAQRLLLAVVEHFQILLAIVFAKATQRILSRMNPVRLEAIPTYRRFQKIDKDSVFYFLMQKTSNHIWMNKIAKLGCCLRADKIIALFADFLIGVREIISWRSKKDICSDIKEVDHFNNDIDKLWNNISSKFRVITKRDRQFLNWRFSDSRPQLDYRMFIATRNSSTTGYIVVRKPAAVELNVGIIADLFADPDDNETIEDLIKHAIHFFGKSVIMIECPATQREYQKVLSKLGFFKMEMNHPIVLCKDTRVRSKLEELKKGWFITKADQDWDQVHPK